MNTNLKPCPFCGGEAELELGNTLDLSYSIDYANVVCDQCCCTTDTIWNKNNLDPVSCQETVDEAVDLWNERVIMKDHDIAELVNNLTKEVHKLCPDAPQCLREVTSKTVVSKLKEM